MLSFILKRMILVVPTFFGVTLIAFFLVHLIPGDAIDVIGGERGVSEELRARLIVQYGLDRSLPEQYLIYLSNLFQGDLGQSTLTRRDIWAEFFSRFPATVELSITAMIFAIVVGLPAGVIAGVRRGTSFDHGVMGAALTGYSMPIFWWALVLIFVFSVSLGWTPVSGRVSVIYFIEPRTGFMLIDSLLSGEKGAFISSVRHLILPSIVLGTIPLAVVARMTRSAMIEVLSDDYIRTARAKGMSAFRVVNIHAFRNALIPVVTVIGLQVGTLLAGAILTETIFSWPGIGKWMVQSIGLRDYPAIQGGVLLIASAVILVNLVVDLLYGVINPRISHT